MSEEKTNRIMLGICWVMLILSIPAGAIGLTYFRDLILGVYSPLATDITRSAVSIFFPFYMYHLTRVYGRGDYVIESGMNKIFECQNEKTKSIRYVSAETVDEAELFLELTDAEESYIVTESEIRVESFKLLIPDTSKANNL